MGENSETSADTPDDEHVIKGASDEPDADTSTDTNDITASDAGGDTNTDTDTDTDIDSNIHTHNEADFHPSDSSTGIGEDASPVVDDHSDQQKHTESSTPDTDTNSDTSQISSTD
jgi:hypothetical protein